MAINDTTTFTETAPDGTEITFDVTAEKADESSLATEVVDALFDEGVEAEVINQADLDGDGTADAVGLDTDKDGKVDMVAGDMDGDGEVDSVGVDTDGDGQIDAIASDMDGDGVVDAIGQDTDGDGKIDTIAADLDGDGEIDAVGYDTDGDGTIDEVEVDSDGDGEIDTLLTDSDGDGEMDTEESLENFEFEAEAEEGLPTDEEISMNSVEFSVGADGFPITDDVANDEYTATATDDVYVESSEVVTPTADPYTADAADGDSDTQQQAYADAAKDAQTQADEFVAQGDYAAAAEAREAAEEAAYQARDSSMLGASDSTDLENAAYRQEVAEEYRAQQAEHIAEGDYEAAKEDALNAGYATSDADYLAGGADHTGQSDQDAYNLGNAVSDEKNAEYFADNAEWYAEQGNFDAAESSAQNAGEYQASADTYADQADPLSTGYDVDPSSAVDAGGTYDAGGYDMAAVDTGFDSGIDTSAATYDTGLDDTTV